MVNTREIAAEYRLTHWAEIIEERIKSGLSIKAFCAQVGICTNTYFYWQRKLRESAYTELVVKPQDTDTNTAKPLVPSGWTICETPEINVSEKALPIEIAGCRLLVTADTDLELLVKVCRMLKSLC